MKIITISTDSKQIAAYDPETTRIERLFDLIVKYDCYGVGSGMVERIGQLTNFFDSKTDEPVRLFISNNALMVLFNICSELLTQKLSEIRMVHSCILYKRKTVAGKQNPTIGSNIRSDVSYGDVQILGEFIAIITPVILSGDSIVIAEETL